MESPLSKTLRRTSLCLVSVAAVAVLGGCAFLPRPGGAESDPPPSQAEDTETDTDTNTSAPDEDVSDTNYRTGPVPSTAPTFDKSELPSKPSDSASPNTQIEWELVKFMNKFGMEYDPSSEATCDHTNGRSDETIDCTGTYGDLDVDFTVEITGGETRFNYTYEAQELPISRDAAEDAYRYRTDSKDVACDMDNYEIVNVGDTGVTCEAKTSTGADKATIETSEKGGPFSFNSL